MTCELRAIREAGWERQARPMQRDPYSPPTLKAGPREGYVVVEASEQDPERRISLPVEAVDLMMASPSPCWCLRLRGDELELLAQADAAPAWSGHYY